MGEYYDWVNVDKKQYLVPMEFGHGSKITESCWYHAEVLGALYSLLSSDWKGDHIAFIGDEAKVPLAPKNETLRRLQKQCMDDSQNRGIDGYILDEYICVSGLFRAAEVEVREEIGNILDEPDYFHNWYGIDPANPYDGLFERELVFFRYVINHDRKEYYDTEHTCWRRTSNKMDPLPLLLAYGRMTGNEEKPGLWLGDRLEVTNNIPGNDYRDITDSHIWDDEWD